MNKVAWSAIVVSLAGFAVVAAGPGCNSSSSNNTGDDGGSSGSSSGTASSSSGSSSSSSSGMGSSSGGMMDSGGMDSSMMDSPAEGSTGEGGVCPAPETGSMSCNTCVDMNCNMQWCTCAADTTTDDAGTPTGGCAAFVQCVSVCAGMDGGSGTACVASCSASDGGATGGPYTATNISNGVALLTCIQGMCTGTPDGGDAGAACQP